jgi:ubiquinol-cytochrome c reductase iron-sulfur subunit
MTPEHTSTELTTADGAAPLPERFPDPGLPGHVARVGDTDPVAAKRAERQVVALFTVSILGTIGFLIAYVAIRPGESVASMRTSTLLLGLGLFLGMFGIGAAAVHWAKSLMSDHERSEPRHPQRSDAATREAALAALGEGAKDSAIGRRSLLKGAVVTAVALVPLAIAVPLVGEVGGDWNVSKFRHTLWRKGVRLARDPSGTPIKASEVTIDSAFHVIPEDLYAEGGEGGPRRENWIEEKAKAIVLMVRLDPADLTERDDRKTWSYDGIVAYSKVCTHVGCPVALYEAQTHHLLCPCHQSTFDIADGAKVIFGPASRPLPQLPITVDDEGYLVAQSDFNEPVGPTYWERLR